MRNFLYISRLWLALAGLAVAATVAYGQGDKASYRGRLSAPLDLNESQGTIEFWFKTSDPTGGLCWPHDSAGNHDRNIWLRNGDVYADLWNNSSLQTIQTTGYNFADGRWHHVAYVYGAAGTKLYMDGIVWASGGFTSSTVTQQNLITFGETLRTEQLYGAVERVLSGTSFDEIRVWNIARSQADIQANMLTHIPGALAGLQASWSFGNISTDNVSVPSLAGGANTATLLDGSSGNYFTEEPFGTISGRAGAPGVTVDLVYDPNGLNGLADVPFELAPDSITSPPIGLDFTYDSPDWPGGAGDYFGLEFRIRFNVYTTTGDYTFFLGSDDGASLDIDGRRVITRDFTTGFNDSSATVNVPNTGALNLVVRYFENTGGQRVRLDFVGPDGARHNIAGGSGAFTEATVARSYRLPRTVATTTSDANGIFIFPNVKNRLYKIRPSRPGYTFSPAERSVVPSNDFSNFFDVTASPPQISDIPNQTINEDTSLDLVFNVSDRQTPASILTVTAASSNQGLVPNANIVLGGSGETRSARFTPLFNAYGPTTITLTVKDETGATGTDTFLLTVSPVNDTPVAGLGAGLKLNGAQHLNAPGFAGLADAVTIEYWLYVDELPAAPAQHSMVALSPDNGANRLLVQTPAADGVVKFFYGSDSLNYTPGAGESPVGSWHHFALVADKAANGGAGRMAIYRDGVLKAEKPTSDALDPENFSPILGQNLKGSFSEFRIWRRARTVFEIGATMNTPLQGNESDLLVYYRFLEQSGPYVFDSAPLVGALTGTLTASGHTWLASARSVTIPVDEDTPRAIILPAFDAEGTNLTYTIVTSPQHGTLSGPINGVFTYSPAADYNGPDSFVYSVRDVGALNSANATVSLLVADANDLPVLSAIGNQVSEEDRAFGPVPFTVLDGDSTSVTVTARSSDPTLVAPGDIVITPATGAPGSRSLTIYPRPGESGTLTITLIAVDNALIPGSTERSFDLRIEPKPAYAIFDLGDVTGRPVSAATAINNRGQVVGYAAQDLTGTASRAFFYNGLDYGGVLTELPSFGATAQAFGINDRNEIAGVSTYPDGRVRGFRYDGILLGDLGTLNGGTLSQALAINGNGLIAGFGGTSGQAAARAFLHGGALTNLGTLAAPFNTASFAYGLNNSNHVVGAAGDAAGRRRAFFYNGTSMMSLGGLTTDTNSAANGINAGGRVVGGSSTVERPGQAVILSGNGEYLKADNGVYFSTNFTVEAWVYVRSVTSWSRLLDFGNDAATHNVIVALSAGNSGAPALQTYREGQASVSSLTAPAPLPLNQWLHLATVFDGNTGRIYVDGKQVASGPLVTPAAVTRTNNFIGKSNWLADGATDAILDDVRIWKTARTPEQILGGMLVPPADAEPGLVSRWRLDEGLGKTSTGAGSQPGNLTLFNGAGWIRPVETGVKRAFYTDLAGGADPTSGAALAFDGNTGAATAEGLNIANHSFTVEFWARRARSATQEFVILQGGFSQNNLLHIGFRADDKFVFGFYGNDINTEQRYPDLEWHHYGLSYNSADRKRVIYRDGVLVATDTAVADFIGSGTFNVARMVTGNAGGFNSFAGMVDEVRVWNSVRTEQEIRDTMFTGPAANANGLLAWWRFDEGTGVTASATGSVGPAITLVSGATWATLPRETGKRAAHFQSLGTLQVGGESEARGVNDFGQIVGTATRDGQARAFLHTAGAMYDLNDVISEEDAGAWKLQQATAINERGEIAGFGISNGRQRAFLAVPANIIGRKVVRPQGAIAAMPQIELLRANPGDDAFNSFFYSEATKKLYAIRPVTARLKWPVSANLLDTNRIDTVTVNIWPKTPQIHIANAPVELQPPGDNYLYFDKLHSTARESKVDPGSKVFTAAGPGYSVIGYLITGGQAPDPKLHAPYFEVARTYLWNDPALLLDGQPAIIGQSLTSPFHQDYPGRNGWLYFEKAFYDGAGADRAYDRVARTGPILPVNKDTSSPEDDLVAIWYKTNSIGVSWAYKPVRYSAVWPASPPEIVVASQLGSGVLDPLVLRQMRVYNQPDKGLAGYNPNEEHAFLAPSNGGQGQGMFALRNDLNAIIGDSEPYSLLKYKDANDTWNIRVYKVVRENATYPFHYGRLASEGFFAGKEIQPPYPLSLLNICAPSKGISGPFWEDYNGKIYAKAAGLTGALTDEIVIHYFYPMQPGFFFDLDKDGKQDAPDGACIPLLDRRAGGTVGTPIDVRYTIRWPDASPVLAIGDTLTTAKAGLPGLRDFAAAKIVFDTVNAQDNSHNVLSAAARMFDPLTPRTIKIPELPAAVIANGKGFQMPGTVKRANVNGKEVFTDLPFDLRVRLTFDPINRWLSFAGYEHDDGGGEPLTLINIMSARERDTIKELDAAAGSDFDKIIDALYELTRNPNGIDLDLNGAPDKALRVGLIKSGSEVMLEPLAGPKALSAGISGLPAPAFNPGNAASFDGVNDFADTGLNINLANRSFTIEFWARRATSGTDDFVVSQGPGGVHQGLYVGFLTNNKFTFGFYDDDVSTVNTYTDAGWHHWGCTFNAETKARVIYRDGVVVASGVADANYTGAGDLILGNLSFALNTGMFGGEVDELRIWTLARSGNSIRNDAGKRLLGTEEGLLRYFRFDETSGATVTDSSALGSDGTLKNGATRVASNAKTGLTPRFVVLAENDDAKLGLPVTLHVIRVEDGPFGGDMRVIFSDNVFDEKVSLRHSADFGGEPERLEFEWYRKPDATPFDRFQLPGLMADGSVDGSQLNGWIRHNGGAGLNAIVIGAGGESSLITLSDNWWVMRYKGFNVNGVTNWSDWIGNPADKNPPGAQFVEGWVKRVVTGLNPFEARTTNFHASAASTFSSMLIQAGHRHEGAIAFNGDPANLNKLGLIEAYSTVLDRARNLSIDGIPPVNFEPANTALLLAGSRIADLYALLGNEAFGDAEDPTIGFTTDGAGYKTLATSIFAFQNQLDSPLEEELVLLRGRDDKNVGVQAAPAYNRLYWNFTSGDGEIAYAQTYNISDQNHDGLINEIDAKTLYPQGHGDAWGHYLTATTTYYQLLRHPNFVWKPRAENVLLAGVPIQVDFLDERKFATVAALKAKAGARIMDLTYRLNWVDDPAGQWQGYKDADTDRAWGVTEWGRRSFTGAYFDWVTANAILPAVDPDSGHTGIQKIDRTTVSELGEIATQAGMVQNELDQADSGLNPVGLAKGVVPFDIDPSLVAAGKTHFEQIEERATQAMNNAVMVWNQANELSEQLRRTQDSTEQFTLNVQDQERDYKNRLIEAFGYPYAGDIGTGQTYPNGYDGPDLYHWMYVNTTEITGESAGTASTMQGFFNRISQVATRNEFFFEGDLASVSSAPLNVVGGALRVDFPLAASRFAFAAPAVWGQRRAPGEIQLALSDLVQQQTRVDQALRNHDTLLKRIDDAVQLLEARNNLSSDNMSTRASAKSDKLKFSLAVANYRAMGMVAKAAASTAIDVSEVIIEAMPTVVGLSSDATSGARAAAKAAGISTARPFKLVDALAQVGQGISEGLRDNVQVKADIDLANRADRFEIEQQLLVVENIMRDELAQRLEVMNQVEILSQTAGRFLAKLATGQRLIEERVAYRQKVAAATQATRYQDMAFRIFRNDALQKYRAQFDLAARYVFLAATAYDYETSLLGSDTRAGRAFLTDIVRQRSLGQMENGQPVAGVRGLADPLARLSQNFHVLKPQLGFNNPQTETGRFSVRSELFRLQNTSDATWRETLTRARIPNLWDLPEYRRFCRPFAPESAGPQPAVVIRFPTSVASGRNFFGWPLGGGDSAYDATLFATKIRGIGAWFTSYNGAGLSVTPRIYLVPAGADVLRAPASGDFDLRFWRVVDQKLPVPFQIGFSDLGKRDWIPANDSLGGSFAEIRRFSSFRAYHDSGFSTSEMTADSRLIGRSVWNTDWLLIIPGATLLNDANAGLDAFISSVSDIKLFFQTYAYSGN